MALAFKSIHRAIMATILCCLMLPHPTHAWNWNMGELLNMAKPLLEQAINSRYAMPAIIISASTALGLGLWYLNRRHHASKIKKRPYLTPTPESPQPSIFSSITKLYNKFFGTTAQADSAPLLAQHVAEYQPATDDQLATVPYFDNPEHHVVPPMRFANNDGQEVIVQQLRVLDQFEETPWGTNIGGGGTSCGYHAGIKNPAAIAGLVHGLNYGAMLTDPQIANDLFNPDPSSLGPLRQQTDIDRKKIALKSFYAHNLASDIPEPENEYENPRQIQSIYRNLLNNIIDDFIAEAFYEQNDIVISPETIIQGIQNLPLDPARYGIEWPQEMLEQFIRDEHTMQRYLHLHCPLHISLDDCDRAWQEYNEAQELMGYEKLEPYGNWLNSEEMEQHVERLCKDDPLFAPLRNIPFKTLESPEMLPYHETVTQLHDSIATRQAPGRPMFAFGLASTDQATRARGHWMTLFLEFVQNKRRYTIADSAGNTLRLFAGPCYDLIKYLERRHFELQPTDQMRAQATE